MQGRKNWTLHFQSTIDIVSFTNPEMKDEIEKTQKIIIPLFDRVEQDIAALCTVIDLFFAQCAIRKELITSLIHQIETLMRDQIGFNLFIKRDKEKVTTSYKQILSNKIDDTLQETISNLKKHLEETLKNLLSYIDQLSPDL